MSPLLKFAAIKLLLCPLLFAAQCNGSACPDATSLLQIDRTIKPGEQRAHEKTDEAELVEASGQKGVEAERFVAEDDDEADITEEGLEVLEDIVSGSTHEGSNLDDEESDIPMVPLVAPDMARGMGGVPIPLDAGFGAPKIPAYMEAGSGAMPYGFQTPIEDGEIAPEIPDLVAPWQEEKEEEEKEEDAPDNGYIPTRQEEESTPTEDLSLKSRKEKAIEKKTMASVKGDLKSVVKSAVKEELEDMAEKGSTRINEKTEIRSTGAEMLSETDTKDGSEKADKEPYLDFDAGQA